jgi:hypothetical protein
MEHIFSRTVLPTRDYDPRRTFLTLKLTRSAIDIYIYISVAPHEQAPPIVTHKSEARPLKRSYAMLGRTL